MQVWKHWQYTHQSTYIFKPHLFPPSVKSIERPTDILRLISWGYTAWPGHGHRWAAGFVIPWIETPIEVRGFLELQAGVSTTGEFDVSEFSMKLAYFNSYFQRVSWYTSVAWMPDPVLTGAHFTVAAGPSFLLWTRPSKSLLGPVSSRSRSGSSVREKAWPSGELTALEAWSIQDHSPPSSIA
jgi:hypothetical protein